jgi:hypothetical protein
MSLKNTKTEINEQLKGINSQIKDVEEELMLIMEEQEIEKFSTEDGTFSLRTSMYAGIEDMKSFIDWIQKTENIGFIQKRASNKAIEEYFEETGVLPPGINTYMKTSIGTRKK